jgi:saccharopine dehydrogenase (NAD+, L-lysine-forming)
LDVTAIDNLPSMLPRESSEDFANQLLPFLMDTDGDVWQRAQAAFEAA